MGCGLTPHLEHTLSFGRFKTGRIRESLQKTDSRDSAARLLPSKPEFLARQEVIMNVHKISPNNSELWVLTTVVWSLIALAYWFVR
jgi:hypothetical protein